MVPWIGGYSVVTIAELVFTVIAFILIDDLHQIFHFFNSAWFLAVS